MNRSLHGLGRTTLRLQHIQCRQSTAFDPWHYLHHDTVRKEQTESFRKVWKNDIGDFKKSLTAEEIELFESKVAKSEKFEDFYGKMRELFSPRRHDAIRNTRTWQFTHNQILKYLNTNKNALKNIIFNNNEDFQIEFKNIYLNDKTESVLLSDFNLSDLRFMCSLQAIDIYGGPSLTPIFGCRYNYHFNIPDPNNHSAHWLNCLYDKINKHDLILITSLNAIKDNKPINQLYFRDKLQSLQPNAIKDEEWREYAKQFMIMDTNTFNDKLDRAFCAFQTDEGVSELKPRFHSDID